MITGPIKIHIRALGSITSFKNSKMLSRGRLITDPTKQKKMDGYTRAIESQLRSAYQTAGGATETGLSLPSWIAACWPADDSVDWLPEIVVRVERVGNGEEGADIQVERLP